MLLFTLCTTVEPVNTALLLANDNTLFFLHTVFQPGQRLLIPGLIRAIIIGFVLRRNPPLLGHL
jgi:hypothetical protein